MSSGVRSEPLRQSMASPGEGMARRKVSERGLYAAARCGVCRKRTDRRESVGGREKNIAGSSAQFVLEGCGAIGGNLVFTQSAISDNEEKGEEERKSSRILMLVQSS
jgi:hypothetical protein